MWELPTGCNREEELAHSTPAVHEECRLHEAPEVEIEEDESARERAVALLISKCKTLLA